MPGNTVKPAPMLPLPGADYQPRQLMLVSSAEQLKTISDPLRMGILESVGSEALTVKQIAARLGQPVTKLYYHVSALEEAGFIVVVDTRIKSGIVEKYYRIAADTIQVDRRLLSQSDGRDAALQTVFSALFDSTIADLQQSFAAGLLGLEEQDAGFDQRLILTRSIYQLRAGDVSRFIERFHALLQEMNAAGDQADTVSYACTLAFYPQVRIDGRKDVKKGVA